MAAQAIDLARKMIEDVYGKGKTELIAQIASEDFVSHDPVAGALDRRGVEENVRTYRSAFPDMRMEMLGSLAAGSELAVRWRATGTHQGELMGVAPSGKRVVVEGITIARVEGGKLVEEWGQWDSLGLMRQIGAAPEAGARAARGDGKGAKGAPGAQASRR